MADPEKLLKVSVVTPDGIIYDKQTDVLELRAVDGEITIMFDHLPIISPLAIGDVRVKNNKKFEHIAVNGGYIEFSDNEATIIADSAELASNIDVKRAESAKTRAEMHLKDAEISHNKNDKLRAEVALRRAINRINIKQKYNG